MKQLLPKILIICVAVFGVSVHTSFCIKTWADAELFPVYPCIQPNISFWTKIYTQYSSYQGVIHDNINLDIIYEVIELEDPDLPSGRKTNRERIKKAKKKYKIILKQLAHGGSPDEPEEKRVADLFGPDAQPVDFKRAIKKIRCQVGQKDRFRQGIIRSGAYLEEIRRIFHKRDLPEDLAYLAHVESSFNPKAYSKFGAAGIWQFTRSTGRQYMQVGYTVDERRDPILSSHAAARLLEKNYYKFQNWPMAITAYNVGTNGMQRAKRHKKTYEAIFQDYKSSIFKFASRNFYSEFLAAREVAKNYQQYFGELKLDKPLESTEVILAGYVSLPELVRHLEIDLEILRPLNPALREPVFAGKKFVPKGYRLRLPVNVDRDWESFIVELSPKIFKHYQKHSRFYTVRRGDTAGQIARRHGIKLKDLIAANNLDHKATIYINQNLYIPAPGGSIPVQVSLKSPSDREKKKGGSRLLLSMANNSLADTTDQSTNSDLKPFKNNEVIISPQLRNLKEKPKLESSPLLVQLNLSPEQKKEISASPQLRLKEEMKQQNSASAYGGSTSNPTKEKSASKSSQDQPLEQRGESKPYKAQVDQTSNAAPETHIAETTLSSPADENLPQKTLQFKDNWLARYQPQKIDVNPVIVFGNLMVERIWHHQDQPIGIIQVEVEETLGHYAEWLKVTASQIRRLNRIRYGRMIHMGQQLKIPLHRVTKEEFEEKRFEYHKELVEDFFEAYRIESIRTYSIKSGDNIWTLSREEFEVPLWLIRRYNVDVDLNKLMPFQNLLIPVVEKII